MDIFQTQIPKYTQMIVLSEMGDMKQAVNALYARFMWIMK